MNKIQNEKLESFLEKNKEKIDSYLIDFIREKMTSFLDGDIYVDILAQIAYAIGEKPLNGNLYDE